MKRGERKSGRSRQGWRKIKRTGSREIFRVKESRIKKKNL